MKMFLVALIALMSVPAFASHEDRGFRPYLGVYGGMDRLFSDAPAIDRTGYNLGAKLVGSFALPTWYIDVGAGYQYNEMYTDNNLYQRSLFVELDARKKMGCFSLGPILAGHKGINNDGNSVYGNDEVLLGGLKGVWQIGESWPVRIETQILTDLAGYGSGRQDVIANIGFQFALAGTPKEQVVIVPPAMPVEKAEKKKVLDEGTVGFETDSARLDSSSKARLRSLGDHLSQMPEAYDKMEIGGHADSRGSDEYNMALSRRRAEAVRNTLIERGVTDEKIEVKAYGESMPIDKDETPEAWSKNRRVDIEFFGVDHEDEFNKHVEEALK